MTSEEYIKAIDILDTKETKLTWYDEVDKKLVIYSRNSLNHESDWTNFICILTEEELLIFQSQIPEGRFSEAQLQLILDLKK